MKKEHDYYLVTICENGYGNKVDMSYFKKQLLGGRGVCGIRTSERNGNVAYQSS